MACLIAFLSIGSADAATLIGGDNAGAGGTTPTWPALSEGRRGSGGGGKVVLLLVVSCDGVAPDDPRDPGAGPPAPTTPGGGTTSAPPQTLEIAKPTATLHLLVRSILVISWEQNLSAKVHVEYSFDDGRWVSTPGVDHGAGVHEQLLLGIPFGEDVSWRVVATDGNDTVTSADAVTPNGFDPRVPVATVYVADASSYDAVGAPYFFVGVADSWFGDDWWGLIVDRLGRVVWSVESPSQTSFMHAHVARDGRSLLLDHNTFWGGFDGPENAEVVRTAIDGTPLHTFATPGAHHPFTDLPDGSLAYGAIGIGGAVDEHVAIVHEDGTIEDVFGCRDWLDSMGIGEGCASNTLTYDEPSNKFLFSHYGLGTIIEVDRSSGDVTRWWGGAGSLWTFDPPESEFFWQHGGHITAQGTLLTSTLNDYGSGAEIVAREYELDDATRTLREIASFGVGDRIFGDVMGEAMYLPNGNLLHNTGSAARLREFTPDGTVVWEMEWIDKDIGRSTPIADLYALLP